MSAVLIDPSYAELTYLTGQPVEALLDSGSLSLWLEHVATPVTFAGQSSFSVRLTGPADRPLTPGAHLLRTSQGDFMLVLEAVARDMRHLHYEAFLTEAAPIAA
ncbi:DUF6916 family protein [Nocardioides sp.]|uniref:DUF6916 family protein n=1 Tax=Nocardioides sp. TaxID=35761 RepID=UPI003D119B99